MRVSHLALCAAAFATSLASAAPRAVAATPEAPATSDTAEWVGRYCTPTGCAGVSSPSTFSQATSFGLACASIAFLARRRRA
jgi:hypothetical protein